MKNKLIRGTVFVLSAMVVLNLYGCGTNTATTKEDTDASAQIEEQTDEEDNDTGDASKDNPRNQDEIGENELLVVSFGTSYNDSRRLTIGAVEDGLEKAFPGYSVRRAFTSQIIIDHVKDRDNEEIDNVKAALDRAVDNGVKNLVVLPTHLMDGYEYNDLVKEVEGYADGFENLAIGEPLLTSDRDFEKVAAAMVECTQEYDDEETAIVFMGHGTEAKSNKVYAKMQSLLTDMGKDNYYIGTVEAEPSIDDVIKSLKKNDYKRVVLRPMMVVAGDHANNDMAGDDKDSWKSRLEAEGYEVETVLEGFGQLPAIQKFYEQHAADAIDKVEKSDAIAEKSDMAKVDEVGDDTAAPVFGTAIKDGTYDIGVECSSSMFRIKSCRLTAKNGELSAELTMGGTGYRYVFLGTPEQAAYTDEKNYIAHKDNKKGEHTFTIPVPALDTRLELSAFSDKKEMWYPRIIVFDASSLTEDAFTESPYSTVESLGIKDGEYKIDVSMSGGSGKASITSPAKLTVKDHKAVAAIEWSSPHYDYMKVGEQKYEPVNTEGNSVFEIPVEVFDSDMKVIGDTTAMSEPHEIEYTLRFDSNSIK